MSWGDHRIVKMSEISEGDYYASKAGKEQSKFTLVVDAPPRDFTIHGFDYLSFEGDFSRPLSTDKTEANRLKMTVRDEGVSKMCFRHLKNCDDVASLTNVRCVKSLSLPDNLNVKDLNFKSFYVNSIFFGADCTIDGVIWPKTPVRLIRFGRRSTYKNVGLDDGTTHIDTGRSCFFVCCSFVNKTLEKIKVPSSFKVSGTIWYNPRAVISVDRAYRRCVEKGLAIDPRELKGHEGIHPAACIA